MIAWSPTWFFPSMKLCMISPQYDFISDKIVYLFWVNGDVDKLTFERRGRPPGCSLTRRRSPLVACTINSNHGVLKFILRWITYRLHSKEVPLCSVTCLLNPWPIRNWNLSQSLLKEMMLIPGTHDHECVQLQV